MRVLFLLFFILLMPVVHGQSNAVVKAYKKVFPTYPFSEPNPIALASNVYPYFRFDGFTDKPVNKEWKVVELQNDYISVLILPEIGGKIWAATERKTGKPFIYYNHTVKFRDIAMRGPWTSGGLEANYGIIGHTPNCATPVDYITTTNEDGSVSCIIGVQELLSQSNWRIEINLPKDKAYFTTRSFWYNNSPVSQPYYHWMNLGVKAGNDLEFVFPGTNYIGHNGEYSDWPVNKTNGKKINFYSENDFGGYKSYHVFGKRTNFFGAYYHQSEDGMARYGDYDDKAGKKIWIWGLSRQGMIWEKMLTDTDGQYVEIQSGRLFNQNAPQSSFTPFKHTDFTPYGSDTWKEYWFPVHGTKGIATATPYGTLNVIYENGWLKLYFSAVQKINDSLYARSKNGIVYHRKVILSPLQTFTDSVKVNINPDSLTVSLGTNKLFFSNNPASDKLSRPLHAPDSFNWNSAYGLYVQGKELYDQKLYAGAEIKLNASLQKDPAFLPALQQLAILQYRNMLYRDALQNIVKCLQFDTEDGESNYYYGLINTALGNETDAIDGFSIATVSQAYRSAAYTELAKIYFKKTDYEKAVYYADRAVAFNNDNINAWLLKAVAMRKQQFISAADSVLKTVLKKDPLNHFARFEQYLLQPGQDKYNHFVSLIRNELPGETYTSMGVWYYTIGCAAEATSLFKMMQPNPESVCWLAFLHNHKAELENVSPLFAFPFRAETAAVMEQLLQKQNDWLLKYQLALIYRNCNRMKECKELLSSCKDEPAFAPFYAVRADIEKSDTVQTERDLIRANELDNNDWRYKKLLADYYITHQQTAKALKVTENYYRQTPANYIMALLYVKTLVLHKDYARADNVMAGVNIIPFEGATEGRVLYRKIKLMLALSQLKEKNYSRAKDYINEAQLWPERLGAGKPYDEDIDDRLENYLFYITEKDKKGEAAQAYLKKIVSFKPTTDNTVNNFFASNALVSALAIKQTENETAALQWLQQQEQTFPEFAPVFEWSKNAVTGDQQITVPGTLADNNFEILMAMQKMSLWK